MTVSTLAVVLACPLVGAAPFTVQGPGVDPADFRVTTFASGLDYPLGMAVLSDGSLLVTTVSNPSFFGGATPGMLLRLADADHDGIADDGGTVLYSGLPNTLSSVRVINDLVFVTGPPHAIFILRMGETPADPLTLAGKLILTYPEGWDEHRHSDLALRKTPDFGDRYDLCFQVGAEVNFGVTSSTVALTNEDISGASGSLAGDAVHMITIIDDGISLSATNLIQIASGARNAAGFTFHPATGDLYFQDNGIDDRNTGDPHSADELNVIVRGEIGGAVEFFGFPDNYTETGTNTFIGGAGIPPLVAFQPIPDPLTGAKSEGPNQISYAPPGFPDGLNTGVFIGFHGIFNNVGTANNENPLVYADPATGAYFHFIAGQQAGIGHLDGLAATRDSLFVADLTTTGSLWSSPSTGVIYQIQSLVIPTPPAFGIERIDTGFQLHWTRGTLLESDDLGGSWTEATDAFSPMSRPLAGPRKFFKIRY